MRPEEAVQQLRAQGYQAEVIYVRVFTVEYRWEKKAQHGMSYYEEGYGLRVIKGGRQGFAYGPRLNDELIKRAIDSAAAVAEDPYVGLPGPERVEPLALSYDPAVEEPHERLRGFIDEMRSYASGPFNLISAGATAGWARTRIVNSEGVDVEALNSFAYVAASANYMKDSYVGPSVSEFRDSKFISGLDVRGMMAELQRKVELTGSRREAKVSGRPVALTPKAVNDLLFPLLNYAVRADMVHRGRSPLKVGEDLGQRITVVDNPRIEGAAWSRAFDGEGLPTKVVTLIDGGRFVRPLSNTYWSRRSGFENTHSSWRAFTDLPAISASYLVISGPSASDIGDAVVVDEVEGVHTSSFDTGDFAVNASVAWDSDGGLREFVLSGNLRDLLKGVQGVVGPATKYGRVLSGTLLVSGLRTS